MEAEKEIEIEVLNRIAAQRGIPIEGVSALYAEIKKHVQLKSAVVEAAKAWNQAEFYTRLQVEDRVSELSQATEALDEFEAKTK